MTGRYVGAYIHSVNNIAMAYKVGLPLVRNASRLVNVKHGLLRFCM